MSYHSVLPRFFYVVLTDNKKHYAVFQNTKHGKYVNQKLTKLSCIEENEFVEGDKLVITNIIEFEEERELDNFIE